MLDGISSYLPKPFRAPVQRLKFQYRIRKLQSEWSVAAAELRGRPQRGRFKRLLIAPSDPLTLFGSLGDDAMITATTQVARSRSRDVVVHILTENDAAAEIARAHGFEPVFVGGGARFPRDLIAALGRFDIDSVVALGADVMDGYYGGWIPARLLSAVDVAARAGLTATVLGFSFNKDPLPELRRVFDRLDPRVNVNVRDQISLDRFRRFSKAPGRLVADAAFSLKPATTHNLSVFGWTADQHTAGRSVIAFNLHPTALKGASGAKLDAMLTVAARSLLRLADERPVAFLFLPHDYRPLVGDVEVLEAIRRQVADKLGERIYALEGEHAAGTLKAIAGSAHGVVTGRMHLSIAALGMGTPVMGVTYQDKFEGLFQHFDLPVDLLMSAKQFEDENELTSRLISFVDRLGPLTNLVRNHLPEVQNKSLDNFIGFGDHVQATDKVSGPIV